MKKLGMLHVSEDFEKLIVYEAIWLVAEANAK